MDAFTTRLALVILAGLGAYALSEGQTADFSLVIVAIAALLPGAPRREP